MESTTPDGDVAKFIEKRGEGVMLISLNVDNTREAMGELQKKIILLLGAPVRFRIANLLLFTPKR